jgi:very-short-patch-repair endonuclease
VIKCKFCDKECKSDNSLRNHERTCPKNENRVYKNGMTGKTPWNKGLSKETDIRVAENAASVSKATKGRPGRVWTEEQKKAKSEWRKELHKTNPESHPNRRLAGNRNKMSYPERVAWDWFAKNGIIAEPQKQVGKYFPDFVIGNVIIEIDGEHWHDPQKDSVRDEYLVSQGYTVYRIKAKEFIENKLETIFKNNRV